ncbi:hypothetical protein GOV05_02455 [Candidatus Woesearchaeota archaeon]|nr:hypothetical protein [Candidatus Woesearchaeota archaeon]
MALKNEKKQEPINNPIKLLRGSKHASIYGWNSPYIFSRLEEEFLYGDLPCGM